MVAVRWFPKVEPRRALATFPAGRLRARESNVHILIAYMSLTELRDTIAAIIPIAEPVIRVAVLPQSVETVDIAVVEIEDRIEA